MFDGNACAGDGRTPTLAPRIRDDSRRHYGIAFGLRCGFDVHVSRLLCCQLGRVRWLRIVPPQSSWPAAEGHPATKPAYAGCPQCLIDHGLYTEPNVGLRGIMGPDS